MALIEVRGLTKIFTRGAEKVRALNGLDLTIEQGEFVAITGASGSGKSTLMHILGLLDRQTAGSYTFAGTTTDNLNDGQRTLVRNERFGFIFQSFHLLPRASALRNVMMPLVYSADRDRNRNASELAKSALAKVGLDDRMNHAPNELSGGQRQRVAIARALVNNPDTLFADEPTGNLDSKTGKEIMDVVRTLNRAGTTVLLVTHDNEISESVPRRLILRDGLIVEDRRAT